MSRVFGLRRRERSTGANAQGFPRSAQARVRPTRSTPNLARQFPTLGLSLTLIRVIILDGREGVRFDVFPDGVVRCWPSVAAAGWASRTGVGGFRRAGGKGDLRAEAAKPAADPGRGEPFGRGGSFPGPTQIIGAASGKPKLGVRGDDDQIGLDILGDQLMWVCPQQSAHNSHRGPRLRKQARPGREHGASSRESCVDTQAPLAKRHGNPVHEQECLVQCGGAACGIGEHLDVVGQLLECGDDAGSDRPRPRGDD